MKSTTTISARQLAGAFVRRRPNVGAVQLQKWMVEWTERRYRETRVWPLTDGDVVKKKFGPVVVDDRGRIVGKQQAVVITLPTEDERLADDVVRDLDKIGAGEALSNWSHRTKLYWVAGEMNHPVPRELMLDIPATRNHDQQIKVEADNTLRWLEEA